MLPCRSSGRSPYPSSRTKVFFTPADGFGAAALGTLINIGVAATEDPQLTYGGIGVVGRDPADAAISDGVQRSANIVTNRVVDRSLAIPPTIRIDAGKRISVIATRRMEF